jgi:hypothetical protein
MAEWGSVQNCSPGKLNQVKAFKHTRNVHTARTLSDDPAFYLGE